MVQYKENTHVHLNRNIDLENRRGQMVLTAPVLRKSALGFDKAGELSTEGHGLDSQYRLTFETYWQYRVLVHDQDYVSQNDKMAMSILIW